MSMLPPCRICGEKASGFHYGVNTCEACKAFFRRSLNKFETYICNKNQSCELPPGRRNFCAFCRFKKCVSMGMCRNAIKTGRYTHEKKANDIKELKGMKEWTAPPEDQIQQELQEKLEVLQREQQTLLSQPDARKHKKRQQQQLDKPQKPGNTPKRQKVKVETVKEEVEEEDRRTSMSDHEDACQTFGIGYAMLQSVASSNESLMSDIPSVPSSLDIINSPLLYSPPGVGSVDTSSAHIDHSPLMLPNLSGESSVVSPMQTFSKFLTGCVETVSNHSHVSTIAASGANSLQVSHHPTLLNGVRAIGGSHLFNSPEVVECLSGVFNDEEELMRVIRRICEVQKANTPYTDEFFRTLPEKEQEYMRQKVLKAQMYGEEKPMSRAEYLQVYAATGIDVDGRRELLEMSLPHIETCIKRYICYVKSIPGFNDLTVNDQICLIKSTRFYCWMVLSHRCFNHELQLHATYDGRIISAEDMAKFNDPEVVQALFDVQKRIQSLNQTHEEACIFAAFCIMSTDHDKLERSEVAERSQELLLRCLLYLFKKHHPEDRMRLPRFMDCFLYMRSSHEEQVKAEEKFASEWAGIVDFPPVLYEIWSS